MNTNLGQELVDAESAAREQRGLPLWHLLDMAEFPFAFAGKELAAFTEAARKWGRDEPTNLTLLFAELYAELANRNYARANQLAMNLKAAGGKRAHAAMRFGPDLEPPSSTELPKVEGAYPTGPSLFLACDAGYFASFGVPLLKSLAAQNINTPLHVHIMAKDKAAVDWLMSSKGRMAVTATWEDPTGFITAHGLAATPFLYYGAARFVRFAEALEQSRGPLCMLDVDALANGDPMTILNRPGAVGVRVRPGRLEPWNQFSGCLVLGRPEGRAYFSQVSNIVKNSLPNAWWGLDQYALFSAWLRTKPALTLFGPRDACINAQDDGVFVFTSGDQKKTLMTDDTPYARLYRKYK